MPSRPRPSGYQRNGWVWQRTVQRILTRDEGRCYVCGGPAVTADHVTPVAWSGSHDDDNLAAICKPCHDAKTKREAALGSTLRRPRTNIARNIERHPNARPRP
jgi:5-methylcytosine-specific restriction protein A